MFHKTELERLRMQKDLLVLQGDLNRLVLATEWQRLRSPENWIHEAGNLARRHPLWTAGLAAAAGMLAVRLVRKPRSVLSGIGQLGELAAAAFSAWKVFRRAKSED